MDEINEENPQVCCNMFCMDIQIFNHLCNELKMLHLVEEDNGIVSVEEAVATCSYIVRHNTDMRLATNGFQRLIKTIQRRFCHALRAIHSLGLIIISPNNYANELLINFMEMESITHGLMYE